MSEKINLRLKVRGFAGKLKWKTNHYRKRLRAALLRAAYSPRSAYREQADASVRFFDIKIDNFASRVAIIQDGAIYSDRGDLVAVMRRRSLVAGVTWHYRYGGTIWDAAPLLQSGAVDVAVAPRKVKGRVISLLTGGGGNGNYFHWLFDCLSRLALVDRVLVREDSDLYLIPDDVCSFQRETLALLGIAPHRCLTSREWQHVQATSLVATIHPNQERWSISPWIIEFLRQSFLKNLPEVASSERIYISREDSHMVRRPTNEEEIVRRLTEVGFSVLYLTQYSVQEQVAIFSRAKMIVGTHGAGLSNLVFAQAGTIVYEFFSSLYQPDMHGTLPYGQIARALAMDYTKIVCEAENPDVTPVLSSFHLPLEHIERIVARARSLPLG